MISVDLSRLRTIEQPPFIHSDSLTRARGRYSTSCVRHNMFNSGLCHYDDDLPPRTCSRHASFYSDSYVTDLIRPQCHQQLSVRPPQRGKGHFLAGYTGRHACHRYVDRRRPTAQRGAQVTTTFNTCRSKPERYSLDDGASPSVTVPWTVIYDIF